MRERLLIKEVVEARNRLVCQSCDKTIVPGDAIRVFIWDGNPGGTGPVQHQKHDPEEYLCHFRERR